MSKYINPYTKYQENLLTYIEVKEVVKTAKDDGKREVAKEMKDSNEPIEKIIKYTGLSADEVDEL